MKERKKINESCDAYGDDEELEDDMKLNSKEIDPITLRVSAKFINKRNSQEEEIS